MTNSNFALTNYTNKIHYVQIKACSWLLIIEVVNLPPQSPNSHKIGHVTSSYYVGLIKHTCLAICGSYYCHWVVFSGLDGTWKCVSTGQTNNLFKTNMQLLAAHVNDICGWFICIHIRWMMYINSHQVYDMYTYTLIIKANSI